MPIFSIPILGFLTLSLLAIYKFAIYPVFLSPLSEITNAHWSAPISPLWIFWTRLQNRENRETHAAHQKLGPVIRLAPNELSVNDLASLRTVYAGGFEKGEWYSVFDNYGVPCMFSAWHSKPHSAKKRMISNVYSKSNIHNSPALHRQAQSILYDRLLPILTAASTPQMSTDGIEIHEIWNATTLDFITAYQFGLKNSSRFLDDQAYRKHWLSLYYSRKGHTFWSQELPRLNRFLRKIGIFLVPRWVDDHNNELEAWTQERCDATLAYITNGHAAEDADPGNEPVVFRAMLNGMQKERDSKGDKSVLITDALQHPELSIASEMIDHLAAGHETSGIMLTYISWHLSQDTQLQDRLRAELLALSPNMLLSNNKKELPSSRDLDNLPVLHAIMMESLRLDAAIPGSQPRQTPFPSCTLGKFSGIPGGVRVGAQAHSLHRNEQVYPEPEKFDYRRWLDDENGRTEEQNRERDRWFWAFSSGGRMCVGNHFAVHEIKLVLAAVYSNFRTFIVDDEGIEQEDGYTVGPQSNRLVLKFERVD